MEQRRVLVWWAVIFGVLGLLAGACSDSEDDSGGDEAAEDGGGDDTAGDTADDAGGEDAGDESGAGDCAGIDATGRSPGGDFTATTAYAVPISDGAAWTLYLADFDLDPETISSFSEPTVPADGKMFTVAITVFNAEGEVEPIEPPKTIEYTDEFGVLTFTVMANEGEELFGTNTGAEGTVEVTAVGDRLCGSVEYTDDEKEISGSFEAEAVDVGM